MKILYFILAALFFLNACESDVSVTAVYLSQNVATLTVGNTLDLEVIIVPEDVDYKTVSWKSNRPAIASVSEHGRVTAVAPGTAVITVSVRDGNKTADCVVTVNEKVIGVTGITLDSDEATLQVGGTLTLNATVKPDDATNPAIKWESGSPTIATVTNGLVTAINPGTAVITASATDGSNKTAECKITVLQPISEFNPTIITGYIPEYRINATAPGDLSYLSIPDRIYFFGIYPTASGEWQLFSSIPPKVNTVKAVMREEQELFVVAGGGASATPNMHVMGNDASKREAYAEALVNYAHQNNFDGIDIDWETDWSKSPAQKVTKEAYVDLMTRIRNKMNSLPESTRVKKLTSALATQSDSHELGLAVVNIVDQISVMVYDVYGTQAEGYPHAPVSMFKTGLENYVTAGIPKQKILGGVPFYGGNKTVSPTQHKAYRDIYNEAYPSLTASMNVWNNFAFNGVDLIREKTHYVISNGYAGMMIWELYQDISYGNGLSLLRAMKQVVDESNKSKNE